MAVVPVLPRSTVSCCNVVSMPRTTIHSLSISIVWPTLNSEESLTEITGLVLPVTACWVVVPVYFTGDLNPLKI